jgi:fatty acid desaturase
MHVSDASYQPAPAAQPGRPGGSYPESSQATLALILGIVGLLLFQPVGPFAWWLGGKEKKAIDAGRRDPANRGQAVAGWVLGIIATVFLILGVLLGVIFVIVGIAAAANA